MKFFEFVEKFVLFLVSCHMFSAFAGFVEVLVLVLTCFLPCFFVRVLGRFGPGLSQGLSLGLVSDLAIRFMYCSTPAFEPHFFLPLPFTCQHVTLLTSLRCPLFFFPTFQAGLPTHPTTPAPPPDVGFKPFRVLALFLPLLLLDFTLS